MISRRPTIQPVAGFRVGATRYGNDDDDDDDDDDDVHAGDFSTQRYWLQSCMLRSQMCHLNIPLFEVTG